jgi:hypothetical protein
VVLHSQMTFGNGSIEELSVAMASCAVSRMDSDYRPLPVKHWRRRELLVRNVALMESFALPVFVWATYLL